MQRWRVWLDSLSATIILVAALTTAVPGTAATGKSAPAPAQSDDVQALVAPVALYPDPILALVLQASTLPVQVVEAERFLANLKKDKKLAPDPDWDPSIIALLNYPRQVQLMSQYLDWTEELGDRVIDDLDGVQAAIQDIRLGAYDAGFLKSDKQQKVALQDDQVRITSTDPETVTIPRYDPTALLAALDAADAAAETADAQAASPAPSGATPRQAAPADRQQPPPDAPAAAAPAEAPAPATVAVPAAPPAEMPAATAAAPPVISYDQPENAFWSSAATFAGGAVIGGLLGWGLTEAFDDDDHDHHHDDWDNDDIEDALRDRREFRDEQRSDMLAAQGQRQDARTEMAGQRQSSRAAMASERQGERDQRQAARQAQADERRGSRDQRDADREGRQAARGDSREERAARAREQLNQRPEAVGGRTKPAAAGSPRVEHASASAERGAREVRLPNAGTEANRPARASRPRSEARSAVRPAGEAARRPATQQRAQAQAGYTRPGLNQGIAAGAGNRRQTRTDAVRGAQSRGIAAHASQPARAQAPQRGGAGSGIAAGSGAARADAGRGRSSRVASAGGGRRGR